MKTNAFGDVVIQPGDDLLAIWNDTHMLDEEPQLTARFIEHEPHIGWSASISDENGIEMEIHDFDSREALVAFLKEQGVEIEDA